MLEAHFRYLLTSSVDNVTLYMAQWLSMLALSMSYSSTINTGHIVSFARALHRPRVCDLSDLLLLYLISLCRIDVPKVAVIDDDLRDGYDQTAH